LQDGTPLSLIMLDIDYFKRYNDSYGHVIGDQVLKLTVKAIESHIKENDLVGRWGGEEFGIALPGASSTQALQVAERIRETLTELPLVDTDKKPIPKPTVSQGIAALLEHTRDVHELIIIADRALYKAKEKGRDQIQTA
jgi:diguanylate cyclase (GGDEF)-like protein